MAPIHESDHIGSPTMNGTSIIDLLSSPELAPKPESGRAHYLRLFGKSSKPETRASGFGGLPKLQDQGRSDVVLDSRSQGSALPKSSSSSNLDLNDHCPALESSLIAKTAKKRKLERSVSDHAIGSTADKGFPAPPDLFNHNTSIPKKHTPTGPKDHAASTLPETPRRFSQRLLQRSVSTTELSKNNLPMVPDRPRSNRNSSRSHYPPGPYNFTDNQTDDRLLEIPFPIQYSSFQMIQHILEYALFDFAKKWIPQLLRDNNWEVPEAGELNRWNVVLGRYAANLPKDALHPRSRLGFAELKELLCRLHHVRHAAVHRLRGPFQGVMAAITEAGDVTFCLQDLHRFHKLSEIRNALQMRNWEGVKKAIQLDTSTVSENTIRKLDNQHTAPASMEPPPIRAIQKATTIEQLEAASLSPIPIDPAPNHKAQTRFSFSPFAQMSGLMLPLSNLFSQSSGLRFSPLNLNHATETKIFKQSNEPKNAMNAPESTQAHSFGQPSLLGNMRQPFGDRRNEVKIPARGLSKPITNAFVDLTADEADEMPRAKRYKVSTLVQHGDMIDLTEDSD